MPYTKLLMLDIFAKSPIPFHQLAVKLQASLRLVS